MGNRYKGQNPVALGGGQGEEEGAGSCYGHWAGEDGNHPDHVSATPWKLHISSRVADTRTPILPLTS